MEKDKTAQRVYSLLRAMAMTYQLPPGARLNEVELARQLEVSRTPLREAMNRLASEGLLVTGPGRGFSARKLDVQEVFDLYETRLALEAAIAEIACERADEEALAAVDAFLDESAREHEGAEVDRLVDLDEGFHDRIAALAGNAEMRRMLANLNARIHFFRWVDMRGRRGTTQQEHRALLVAIRARDRNAARAVMRNHISRRLDQIVEVIREGYGRLFMGEGPSGPRLHP